MSDNEGFGLVMPFVSVASKGGPYDDTAYCAGWHMGGLDARLEGRGEPVLHDTIREADRAQADLVAMRHGYRLGVVVSEVDGWVFAEFTRVDPDAALGGGDQP